VGKLDAAALRAAYDGPHELVTTSDGKTLFVRRWGTADKTPVSVLILHGITAHSGPYGPMIAETLALAGFNVFGMDLRGHGLSDGVRGDYPSEDRLIKDLSETVALVKGRSRKVVVLGHSLGALAAVVAVKSRPVDIDGLVLISAAKKVRAGVYAKPNAGATLRALLGATLMQGTPLIEYRRSGMLGLDDPLFNFRYSARFYSVLYGVGALSVSRMLRTGMIASPHLELDGRLRKPLLIAVGDGDELFAVDSAREFYEGIDAEDKEFLVVPGARHAVFPKDAWGPLVLWLQTKF
jgi:alpha-beta hydrolase superfamily lysophospholipase